MRGTLATSTKLALSPGGAGFPPDGCSGLPESRSQTAFQLVQLFLYLKICFGISCVPWYIVFKTPITSSKTKAEGDHKGPQFKTASGKWVKI